MNFLLKITVPFIFIIFLSCSAQEKNKKEVFKISYKAETRGSFIIIHFKDSSLVLKSTSADKSVVLSNAEVINIQNIASKIKLSEIGALIAPSNERYKDAALTGSFIILKNDTSYTSSNFDHGNPPKELQELYNILQKYLK